MGSRSRSSNTSQTQTTATQTTVGPSGVNLQDGSQLIQIDETDNSNTTNIDDRDTIDNRVDARTFITGTDGETALAAIQSQNDFLAGVSAHYDSVLETQSQSYAETLAAIERVSYAAISNAEEAAAAQASTTAELLARSFGGNVEQYFDPAFGKPSSSAEATEADNDAGGLGGLPSGPVIVGTLATLAVLALAA